MSFSHQGKDISALPGCMSHYYNPAFQAIPYLAIYEENPTQSYIE